MYFTDRGIEELEDRRADDTVTLGWLAERLREFVDLNPESESAVERLATWLARLDDDPDDESAADDDAVAIVVTGTHGTTGSRQGTTSSGQRATGSRQGVTGLDADRYDDPDAGL
jgi:Family of unknown function (DUF6104)